MPTYKNNKQNTMPCKKILLKSEIRTFKLLTNYKNTQMNILILSLKRNLKSLSQFKLKLKVKVNNLKLRRKFNNLLKERRRKVTNPHLKLLKLLFLKLFNKNPLQWHLYQNKNQNLEKIKINLKNLRKVRILLLRKNKNQWKNKNQLQKLKFQKKNNQLKLKTNQLKAVKLTKTKRKDDKIGLRSINYL